jgi:DNA-binding transcriptional ArsR family regulator
MTPLYRNRKAATEAAEKLKIFAQPYRLMIISALSDGERAVGEIAALTGIAQPALSQQLAALRRAGLVRTRKHAKQVLYALCEETARACIATLETMFGRGARSVRIEPQPQGLGLSRAVPAPGGVARFAEIEPR